jgi:hypothetical protein
MVFQDSTQPADRHREGAFVTGVCSRSPRRPGRMRFANAFLFQKTEPILDCLFMPNATV